jgi:dihydroorotate dehydrogenase
VYPHADYVTGNISSPNTQNLRALQSDAALDTLLGAIAERREAQTHMSSEATEAVEEVRAEGGMPVHPNTTQLPANEPPPPEEDLYAATNFSV